MKENLIYIPFKDVEKELKRIIDNSVIYFIKEIYPTLKILGQAIILGWGLNYIFKGMI